MNKLVTADEAVKKVENGLTVMIGGFMACGSPDTIIDALIRKGVNNLTVIANDTAMPGRGIGKLITNKQIKKVIASHIGTNMETGNQMNAGELEVELIPQGTLVEIIRAAGAGLGGILTPTGIGTLVENNKKVIEVNGKKFLLELPLEADIALIKAYKADRYGNLIYNKSACNFNPVMALAAKYVIAEVEEFIEHGSIDPEIVKTPGLFINMIVRSEDKHGNKY